MMKNYREAVDAALQALLPPPELFSDPVPVGDDEIPQPLRSAMAYSLLLPGKRLRPVLLLASYAMLREDWERVLPFACALEMIHTYSLIHDDLPALDNDSLRRGQPSNHVVFGEDMALLAGDGLLNLAYETMLSSELCAERPAEAIAAMREIAVRAGVTGMIAGQTLDVKLEDHAPTEEVVRYIHQHKTADLLTAPVAAGLLLAGASPEEISAGIRFGQHLGIAFQIQDDILDIVGDAKLLGKAVHKDEDSGKNTWPSLFGLEASRRDAGSHAEAAIAALEPFGSKADELRELAQKLTDRQY